MRLLHARELPEKPKNADCWAPFPRRGCSRPSVGPGDLHALPACWAMLAPGPSRISGLSAQWKVHVLTAAAPLARPEPQQLPGPPPSLAAFPDTVLERAPYFPELPDGVKRL